MKLETFFEKFDQLADAPDAVEKLRELVLNFAVTGRLSERRAGDAPVSKLVETLSAAKTGRGKNGRRGAATAVPAESIIEFPIVAPPHWAWVPLSEIGAMSGGMTPSKDKSVFWNGDVNWFSSKDIKTDELTESELRITHEAIEATGLQLYSPGCLVMVARSGILKRTFPVSILRVEGTVNQDLKVLSPFVSGIERYLQIMLRGMTGFILTSLVKTGMTVQSLKYEEFEAQSFPLPPLGEQKRIVAKVDELMALCDRLEAQQQEGEIRRGELARASLARFADAPTPANLPFLFHKSYPITPAELRKSILTLAVQGKLAPQSNDESADASVEQVSKDAKKAIRDGVIRRHGLEQPSDDSDLSELPFGWRWTRLVEVTRPVQYAIKRGPFGSAIRKDMFVPSGFKVYEQQHAIAGDFTRGRYYINEVKFAELRAFELHPNEILVSCSGTVGKVAIVPATIEPGIINQALLKLSLHQSALLNTYFLILFPAFFMETDTLTNLSGTAQKNIPGMDVLKAMPFPLPPLAEQRRIIAKVEQLLALVDALETQLAASRTTAANLLSALVAALTTQDCAQTTLEFAA